jgi:hypothetical protein
MLPLIRYYIPVDLLRNIPEDELDFIVTLAPGDNEAYAV